MARKKKTESLTSPQGGNRGCLCEDGTYNVNCCDGTLQAQGVGKSNLEKTNTNSLPAKPVDVGNNSTIVSS